jgi:glycosyltransferase involved in cell wall biosynthesis
MQRPNMIVAKQPLGTVAYIGTKIDEPFCYSFAQLVAACAEYVTPPGFYIHVDHSPEGNQITARNELVKKMQGQWLLQLDTDESFEPDLLVRMLNLFENNNLDVLCARYHYRKPPYNPVLYQYDDGKYKAVIRWDCSDEVRLLPIGAAGAGALLVRRSVFDRMRKEWPTEMPFDNFAPYKYDDFNFFERCRVLGIPAYCAAQIEVQHLGMTAYGSKDFQAELYPASSVKECNVGV